MGKVRIIYPCQWLYKVIGVDQEQLRRVLLEIARDSVCTISSSYSSRGLKYHCLNLEVTVQSEEQRNAIFAALKAHPQVKMVL